MFQPSMHAEEAAVAPPCAWPLTSLDVLPRRLDRQDFLAHLGQRIQHGGQSFAVLYLDLDRFHLVNGALGRELGDRVLLEIARRLEQALPTTALVARIGGDEIAVLVEDIDSPDSALRLARRIRQEVLRSIRLDKRDIFLSVRIGIALSADVGGMAEDVLLASEMAMYHAKREGRACTLFERGMRTFDTASFDLEHELRKAIPRDELELCFQPIHELPSRRVVALEALLRWRHPRHGLLLPSQFLEVAALSGQLPSLERWALRHSCQQLIAWRAENPSLRDLRLSVNLSPEWLSDASLIGDLDQILASTGLAPELLKLELTETARLTHSETARLILEALSQRQIGLFIDDFGTGYSCLSYLHRVPSEALKIDQSFIAGLGHEPEHAEIVRTVVSLARGLGKLVIAEGVEKAAQAKLLQELGCDYVQGYYFSRPLENEKVAGWLERGLAIA